MEEVELWARDPVECVRELIGNPLFRENIRYAPERVWVAGRRRTQRRVYGEMWSADWWWKTQVSAKRLNFLYPANSSSDRLDLIKK